MSISSRTRSKLKQREESRSLLLNLPEEVHDEIFLKLPAKSILSTRCVCKLFYNLLSKPSFIKNHLNLTNQRNIFPKLLFNHSSPGNPPMIYSIPIDYASMLLSTPTSSSSLSSIPSCEYDGAILLNYPFEYKNFNLVDFLGSSNGLVCLKIDNFNRAEKGKFVQTYSILNPLTREYKEFTKPGFGYLYYDITYGFGYDSDIDDYKLVIISDYIRIGSLKVDVYTIRSDSWSSIQSTVSYSFHSGGKGSRGVYFHGTLHWLGTTTTQETSSEVIICFDVSSEKMVHMPLPDNIIPPIDCRRVMYANVGVWGDCICVAFIWVTARMDVWVMQEYKVKESWSKQFTTTQLPCLVYVNPYLKPLWCYDSGEILIDNCGQQLLLCDPTNDKVRSVVFRDIKLDYNRDSYVESIVSLNTGAYLEKSIADGIMKDSE